MFYIRPINSSSRVIALSLCLLVGVTGWHIVASAQETDPPPAARSGDTEGQPDTDQSDPESTGEKNGASKWSSLIKLSVDNAPIVVGVASLLTALFVWFTFWRERRRSYYQYLGGQWADYVNIGGENAQFTSCQYTDWYFESPDRDEFAKYDAYARRAWGLVENIVELKFNIDIQFSPIIRQIISLHYVWLERNRLLFKSKKLWKMVKKEKDLADVLRPALTNMNPLPQTDKKRIDWAQVYNNYFGLILSPFAPVMVEGPEPRNLLIRELNKRCGLQGKRILELGCGPGTLMPHLPKSVSEIYVIDKTEEAVRKAVVAARDPKHPVKCFAICADMCNLPFCCKTKFDLIISSNSVLPETRKQVNEMWRSIKRVLDPQGEVLCILPAFDAVEHYLKVWMAALTKVIDKPNDPIRLSEIRLPKPDEHAESTSDAKEIVARYMHLKLYDEEDLKFADDRTKVQCYHTREKAEKELDRVGLKALRWEKLYYPWALTARYDYGIPRFAEKEFMEDIFGSQDADKIEEIWDWFVIIEHE